MLAAAPARCLCNVCAYLFQLCWHSDSHIFGFHLLPIFSRKRKIVNKTLRFYSVVYGQAEVVTFRKVSKRDLQYNKFWMIPQKLWLFCFSWKHPSCTPGCSVRECTSSCGLCMMWRWHILPQSWTVIKHGRTIITSHLLWNCHSCVSVNNSADFWIILFSITVMFLGESGSSWR